MLYEEKIPDKITDPYHVEENVLFGFSFLLLLLLFPPSLLIGKSSRVAHEFSAIVFLLTYVHTYKHCLAIFLDSAGF